MNNFNDVALPEALLAKLNKIGFETPTPIQAKAIPSALEGRDILGSAQTGTGKTGAFGIPLIAHLLKDKKNKALVLLPTRELALQVMNNLRDFSVGKKISTALLIGGQNYHSQFQQLKHNPRLIVATPGRLNDHLRRETADITETSYLVLDETDRMLDLGFGIQLEEIAQHLSDERQTLMFSATLPKNIQQLSDKYLTNPLRISVGETNQTAKNITQTNIELPSKQKYSTLIEELGNRDGSVVIFVKTKRSADDISSRLNDEGHRANALHGDLRQRKRDRVIQNFRNEKCRILVATDIAARGLDIPHIKHVINYDLPQCPEDYIHRIGRTARAGAEGQALNLISKADLYHWKQIDRLLNPENYANDSEAPSERRNSSNRRFKGRPFRGKKSGSGNGKPFAKRGDAKRPAGKRADGKRSDAKRADGKRVDFKRSDAKRSDSNNKGRPFAKPKRQNRRPSTKAA